MNLCQQCRKQSAAVKAVISRKSDSVHALVPRAAHDPLPNCVGGRVGHGLLAKNVLLPDIGRRVGHDLLGAVVHDPNVALITSFLELPLSRKFPCVSIGSS